MHVTRLATNPARRCSARPSVWTRKNIRNDGRRCQGYQELQKGHGG